MTLFAEDGVVPYDPSQIVLPFTKVWDDNDDEFGLRPDSITVKRYRYKGDSYTESDQYDTATVTAAAGWTYNFAVAEEPVDNYTEDESAHKDPQVTMEIVHGDDTWIWVRPNSVLEYEVETDTYPKNFLAAKKGNQLYIWTPEELSPLEQMIVLAEVHEHNQFPDESWEDTDFLTGFGHHSAGFTMNAGDPGSIVFDNHPAWSFWARGTYNRSTVDEHEGSITNTVETTEVTVTKVWEDEDDLEGLRPDSVEIKLYNGETAVEDADPLILDEDCEWTGTWEGLPKYAGGEPIEYTVKETETDVITVRLLADGKEVSSVKITAKDSWKASFKDLPAEKDGKKIEYTVSEDKVSEYTAAISGSADKGFTIKNSHTPKKDPGKPDGPKTGDGSDLYLALFGRRYLIRKR